LYTLHNASFLSYGYNLAIFSFSTVLRERTENEIIKQKSRRQPREAVYDRYMEFEEIDTLLHELAEANPGLVSLVELATSTEGRHLEVLKISSGAGKKSIWVDCALHAREWIGPPVCLRIIDEVLADPALQQLVDWYILPVANPDGYSYAWSDVSFRRTKKILPFANFFLISAGSLLEEDPSRQSQLKLRRH
jgi:murein tripeptide amidase MpaA